MWITTLASSPRLEESTKELKGGQVRGEAQVGGYRVGRIYKRIESSLPTSVTLATTPLEESTKELKVASSYLAINSSTL